MAEALMLVRAVHMGAAIVLFGQFVFLRFVWPARQPHPEFIITAAGSLAIAILSAAAWLVLEAQSMSGLPIRQALQPGTLSVVLLQTLFGRVWVFRIVAALVLAATLWAIQRARDLYRPALLTFAGLLALFFLLTIAFAGHAAAGDPADRIVRLGADMLHLLAAGGWLGALVPLILMFHRAAGDGRLQALRVASQATRRFSSLGVASVATLVASGLINASFTVGDVRSLVESEYGRLLETKLVIFLLILLLAAVNRLVLTPKLVAGASSDSRLQYLGRLRRTSIVELILGVAIVVIVGKLGITVPAVHFHMH